MPLTFFLLIDLSLNSSQAEKISQNRNEKKPKYLYAAEGEGFLKLREKRRVLKETRDLAF